MLALMVVAAFIVVVVTMYDLRDCHESQDEYFRQVELLWKQDEVRKSPLQ